MANTFIEPFHAQHESSLGDQDYEFIRRLVYENSRISLGPDKQALVATRVSKRLRKLNLASYAEYCRLLKGPGGTEELTFLVDVISTNHTHFFREMRHFDYLREEILPSIVRQKPIGHVFRAWSAASSSGEEAYSIAILLSEFFSRHPGRSWFIEGTDISTQMLAKASAGVYTTDRLESVPRELQRKYFQRGFGEHEGFFRVKEELRNQTSFRHLNLLQPLYPWDQTFDVIFCRNVMIYFDRPTQETLVGQLARHLEPGGHLMVGHSESLGGIRHPLRTVQPALYMKP